MAAEEIVATLKQFGKLLSAQFPNPNVVRARVY